MKPRIGAHLPIGKGLKHTIDEAVNIGAEALQIFLRNPRGRGARELSGEEIDYFITKKEEYNINPVVVHIPYICNPAAAKEDIYAFALEVVEHDLVRCDQVQADYLVLHPGSYTTSTPEQGIERVASLLNRVLEKYTGNTMILLETMAGQGTELGRDFEELYHIIQKVEHREKVGICFDTCHTFAAGYSWSTDEKMQNLLEAMDNLFGREKVRVIHVNDSEKEQGMHRDRHAHIGQGMIGMDGFLKLLQNDFFMKIPFILETPFEGVANDINILKELRSNRGI